MAGNDATNVTSLASLPVAPLAAFVTGSRVYGSPRQDSDVDLVVLLSPEDVALLSDFGDGRPEIKSGDEYDPGDVVLRFGPLNLICLSNAVHFKAWKEVNARMAEESLCGLKPLTREQAVERLRAARKAAGVAMWK